jgi:site-specific DNA-cytosine methylase
LAIGLEKAGIKCEALNEMDKWACRTLRNNRPNWNVIVGDIRNIGTVNSTLSEPKKVLTLFKQKYEHTRITSL